MRSPSRALLGAIALVCGPLVTPSTADGRDTARSVSSHRIVSREDPPVRIDLPASARFVGADRFILYGMSNCELYAFADFDSRHRVRRLYWIQFESYLPTRPELHHTYDSPRHVTLAGLDFYVDTWVDDRHDEPGSDSEHLKGLLQAKGLAAPAGMLSVRLVHLVDDQKRRELMIIYSEDSAITGIAGDDLRRGGAAHDRWHAIQEALELRGLAKIHLARLPGIGQ